MQSLVAIFHVNDFFVVDMPKAALAGRWSDRGLCLLCLERLVRDSRELNRQHVFLISIGQLEELHFITI